MNIILILAHEFYRVRKTKVLYDMFTTYHKKSINNVKIIWTDHHKKYNRNKIEKLKPDIILFGDIDNMRHGKNFSYVFDMGIHISYIGTDLFYFEKCSSCSYIKRCSSIIHLGKCKKLSDKYGQRFPNKKIVSTSSRFVNTERFHDHGLSKKYDIFIYGSRGGFYPLRIKLENIVKTLQKKYKVRIQESAGGTNSRMTANEELSKLINQSYITMATTGSKESICFFKYNEIAASNSLIFGDIPEDYRELYDGNILELTLDMDEGEITDKIISCLEDKKKIIELSSKFGEKIRNEHNLDVFTKEFDVIIKNLV